MTPDSPRVLVVEDDGPPSGAALAAESHTVPRHTYGPGGTTRSGGSTVTDGDARRRERERRAKGKAARRARKTQRRRGR